MNTQDPFNLSRFISAQDACFHNVVAELDKGQKKSHWMWFVFPQIVGLGFSDVSLFFSIKSKAEASAYVNHPVLGARLLLCTEKMMAHTDLSARAILGDPDFLKFQSSLTLFHTITPAESLYKEAIDVFYQGRFDERTLEILDEI